MNKIKNLMDKYGLSEYQVTRYTGQVRRADALKDVASGKRDINSVNLNLLSSFARGLGLRLEDLLEDYELDGSSTQVDSIKRYVEKLRKHNNVKSKDKGFMLSNKMNSDKFEYKRNYEFLNPKLPHNRQSNNATYLLNNMYLNVLMDHSESTKNTTLAKLAPRFRKRVESVIIYSPLKDGGDLMFIGNAVDKFGVMFSEVIGCEWIDRDDNKTICYYKAHSDKPILSEEVRKMKKEEISELEFYEALNPQWALYNIIE